jgi:hypothetical protein
MISIRFAGKTAAVSAAKPAYAASNLSALVRVSCERRAMAIVSADASSLGDIDAVTLVANSPPILARQTAAIQTVLINLIPQLSRREK